MTRTTGQEELQRRRTGGLLAARDRPAPSLLAVAAIVLGVVAASALAALAISLTRPRVYGAQADLVVQPGGDASAFGAERDLATQETILRGRAVLGPVASANRIPLERLENMVSVENPPQSNILRLTVASRDRRSAQRLAELITDEYLGLSSRAGDGAPDPLAAQLERQVETVSRTLSETLDRLERLARERRPGQPVAPEEQRLRAGSTAMLQRIGTLQDQLTALAARRLGRAEVTVVVPPHLLERPLQPRPVQALAVGTLLGLLGASGVVLLLLRPRLQRNADRWDDGWR
jgi:uncharacterized protein involved in exopolysaccharide biosynthesis